MGTFGSSFMEPVLQEEQRRQTEMATNRMRTLLPGEVQHQGDLSRLQRAQAGQLEAKTSSDAALQAMMREYQPKAGATQSTQLSELAAMAMKAGDKTLATTLLHRSSQAELAEERANALTERARFDASKAAQRQKDRFDQLFAAVKDERELALAKMLYLQEDGIDDADREMVNQITLEALPYLRRAATTQAHKEKRADVQARESRVAATAAGVAARGAARLSIAERDLDLRREREDRLSKNGGKKLTNVTPGELEGARTFLRTIPEFEGMDDRISRNSAVQTLAERARQMREANPALQPGEARARAYTELQASGAFTTEEGGPMSFGKPVRRFDPRKATKAAEPEEDLPKDLKGFKPKTGVIYKRGGARYRYDAGRGGLVKEGV